MLLLLHCALCAVRKRADHEGLELSMPRSALPCAGLFTVAAIAPSWNGTTAIRQDARQPGHGIQRHCIASYRRWMLGR
ncbi:hypothetical protein BGZ61DRAFT_439040 [Ilyonectria robusta]|uniref:uncharacterized protein n=1 Tax=Ilyonectria robusta TaxID=1079257 RepID=UPI001E8D0C26|nr:uncharacterized protein BGZ61DRAFT_439040 [Ilyonectria robusta]KAH8737809.1 hypothetical protein BGZ61DRAFT_439040 [Ilyonectria robusta]